MERYELEIKVHSGLDTAKPAIKLWYLAKAASDTGIASLSLSKSASTLAVSERTILHYLTEGKRFGYFRDWKRDGDSIIIYYSSIVTICNRHGYKLGYSAYIETTILPELKQVVAEIVAQALQAASRHAARRAQQRLNRKNINLPRPEDYFQPPSKLSSGVLGYYGKDILLLSQSVVPYGASVNGIANNIGRHPQTIKNRLRGSMKVRLAHRNFLNRSELAILEEEWDEAAGKYFPYQGHIYKLHTNVYMPRYDLKSCKVLKGRIRKAEYVEPQQVQSISSLNVIKGECIVSSSSAWSLTSQGG